MTNYNYKIQKLKILRWNKIMLQLKYIYSISLKKYKQGNNSNIL